MKKEDQFFLIFLSTILITRIILFIAGLIAPDPDDMGLIIVGFRVHHWMYGVLLVLVAFIFRKLILAAIGAGLFVDELTYLLIRGSTHADNYSWISLSGTFLFLLIFFILRKKITASWEKYAQR